MPLDAFTNVFAGNPLDRASYSGADADWIAEQAGRSGHAWRWRCGTASRWSRTRRAATACRSPTCAHGPGPRDWPAATSGCCSWACGRRPRSSPSTWRARPIRPRGRWRASAGSRTCARRPAPAGRRRGDPGHRQGDVRVAPAARLLRRLRPAHDRRSTAAGSASATACRTEHFPRTDPVVIMLPTIGETLPAGPPGGVAQGHVSRRWPASSSPARASRRPARASCTRRPACAPTRVRYHSTQPWPYPSSLMIGLIAEVEDENAVADQTEIEEVRWFTRAEKRWSADRGRAERRPRARRAWPSRFQLIKAWADAGWDAQPG